MATFGLYGKLVAGPGQRDALVEVLLDAASALSKMPECELYIVNVLDDEPDAVWVTEVWSDETAHKASSHDEEIRSIVQRGLPLVAEMAHQIRLTPVGGKGLP